DRRARPLEPRVHVRLEDGPRRDEEIPRGGLHAELADGDRDGRGDEGARRRALAEVGTVREGQTFAGESAMARWMSFVKLPHTVFALPFALVGVTLATRVAPLTLTSLG